MFLECVVLRKLFGHPSVMYRKIPYTYSMPQNLKKCTFFYEGENLFFFF